MYHGGTIQSAMVPNMVPKLLRKPLEKLTSTLAEVKPVGVTDAVEDDVMLSDVDKTESIILTLSLFLESKNTLYDQKHGADRGSRKVWRGGSQHRCPENRSFPRR